jgi:hypothetical protein
MGILAQTVVRLFELVIIGRNVTGILQTFRWPREIRVIPWLGLVNRFLNALKLTGQQLTGEKEICRKTHAEKEAVLVTRNRRLEFDANSRKHFGVFPHLNRFNNFDEANSAWDAPTIERLYQAYGKINEIFING